MGIQYLVVSETQTILHGPKKELGAAEDTVPFTMGWEVVFIIQMPWMMELMREKRRRLQDSRDQECEQCVVLLVESGELCWNLACTQHQFEMELHGQLKAAKKISAEVSHGLVDFVLNSAWANVGKVRQERDSALSSLQNCQKHGLQAGCAISKLADWIDSGESERWQWMMQDGVGIINRFLELQVGFLGPNWKLELQQDVCWSGRYEYQTWACSCTYILKKRARRQTR